MAILEVQMSAGERIIAESGAMVYMRGEIEVQTRSRKGGLWTKVKVSTVEMNPSLSMTLSQLVIVL